MNERISEQVGAARGAPPTNARIRGRSIFEQVRQPSVAGEGRYVFVVHRQTNAAHNLIRLHPACRAFCAETPAGRPTVEMASRNDAVPSPNRRFPPPWSVEEEEACFIVRDADGQALAYVHFEVEPGRRSAAHLLTCDEARRIAAT